MQREPFLPLETNQPKIYTDQLLCKRGTRYLSYFLYHLSKPRSTQAVLLLLDRSKLRILCFSIFCLISRLVSSENRPFPFINMNVYCKLLSRRGKILTCHPSHVASEMMMMVLVAYGALLWHATRASGKQLLHCSPQSRGKESKVEGAKVSLGRPKERAYHNLL